MDARPAPAAGYGTHSVYEGRSRAPAAGGDLDLDGHALEDRTEPLVVTVDARVSRLARLSGHDSCTRDRKDSSMTCTIVLVHGPFAEATALRPAA